MDRKLWLIVAALAIAGCRSQPVMDNPFLPQTTVPPPGTAGSGTAPLYNAAPATIAPGGAPSATLGAPSTFTPSTVAPSPIYPQPGGTSAPLTPAAPLNPAAPTTNTPYYPPGGTFDFRQQSQNGVNRLDVLGAEEAEPEIDHGDRFVSRRTTRDSDSLTSHDLADAELPRHTVGFRVAVPGGNSRDSAAGWSPESRGSASETGTIARIGEVPDDDGHGEAAARRSTSFAEAAQVSYTEPRSKARPAAQQEPRYSHDEQYGRLSGRLEYSQATGRWKLRYIPIDGQTDRYGGSVIVSNPDQLTGYRPGEFITVHGAVTTEPANGSQFSPKYEIRQTARPSA